MRLYHGTIYDFEVPDPTLGHEGTDFGVGFYVTESERMADDWYKGELNKHINIYDVTLKKINTCELKIRRYSVADVDWAKFVYRNRRKKAPQTQFDIIIGPLADNGLNKWFDKIDNNEITWEDLAQSIIFDKYKSLQYCFKTAKSINLLEYENRK